MSDKLEVMCPKCSKIREIRREWIGRKAECQCGNEFILELPGAMTRAAGKSPDVELRKAAKVSKVVIPVVQNFEIKKTLLGGYKARFKCPHCDSQLHSDESELQSGDQCPECNRPFRVSKDAIDEIDSRRERVRAEKLMKEQEKQNLAEIARDRANLDAERKAIEKQQRKVGDDVPSRITCRFCGEEIAASAIKCRYCNEFLDGRSRESGKMSGSRVNAEKTLYKSNPSMIRNNPVGFVFSVALCLVVIGIPILLIWWLRCKGTVLIVTDMRTSLRRGILSKFTNDVLHRDVRNVLIKQSFFQRIFDVGSIGISSAGQSGVEIAVSGLPSPYKVKSLIDQHRQNAM